MNLEEIKENSIFTGLNTRSKLKNRRNRNIF